MTETKNDLRAIEEMLESAYGDGSQKWVYDEGAREVRLENGLTMFEGPSVDEGQWEFTAPFLAASPEIVKGLVAEVRELRAARAAGEGKRTDLWCAFCGERGDHDESTCSVE
jgi:hypothetical protein